MEGMLFIMKDYYNKYESGVPRKELTTPFASTTGGRMMQGYPSGMLKSLHTEFAIPCHVGLRMSMQFKSGPSFTITDSASFEGYADYLKKRGKATLEEEGFVMVEVHANTSVKKMEGVSLGKGPKKKGRDDATNYSALSQIVFDGKRRPHQ